MGSVVSGGTLVLLMLLQRCTAATTTTHHMKTPPRKTSWHRHHQQARRDRAGDDVEPAAEEPPVPEPAGPGLQARVQDKLPRELQQQPVLPIPVRAFDAGCAVLCPPFGVLYRPSCFWPLPAGSSKWRISGKIRLLLFVCSPLLLCAVLCEAIP